jgi:hypothetical protein
MQRFRVAGLAPDFSIWEPVRFRAPAIAATLAMRGFRKRVCFERAAEDPLRARG